MRRLLLFLLLPLLFSGCRKIVENIQEDRIVDAMTSGQWKVVLFTHNDVSYTGAFAPYTFQFHKNKTVEALQGAATEQTGEWEGDAENRTMMASFPNAADPLVRLNGTWKIDKNSWTYVEASIFTAGDTRKLRLEKL